MVHIQLYIYISHQQKQQGHLCHRSPPMISPGLGQGLQIAFPLCGEPLLHQHRVVQGVRAVIYIYMEGL